MNDQTSADPTRPGTRRAILMALVMIGTGASIPASAQGPDTVVALENDAATCLDFYIDELGTLPRTPEWESVRQTVRSQMRGCSDDLLHKLIAGGLSEHDAQDRVTALVARENASHSHP
jgi:hypothetical protein